MFLVSAQGFSADSLARQQVGMLVRLNALQVNINAALKTRGDVRIGGSSFINGHDAPPSGWSGCTIQPSMPGLRLPPADSSQIQFNGCNNMSCLDGVPKIQTDPTITDSSLTTFGDVEWAELVSMASKILGPGTYTQVKPSFDGGGACNTANMKNWGDPLNPSSTCGGYFPILYATGDISVNGNQGQGVLIVDGDLSVQGGFEFFGPVIVRGKLKTTGTGGHFNGGVIAANVDLEQNTVLGNAVINYSSCALERALNASATGSLIRERGWMTVY